MHYILQEKVVIKENLLILQNNTNRLHNVKHYEKEPVTRLCPHAEADMIRTAGTQRF